MVKNERDGKTNKIIPVRAREISQEVAARIAGLDRTEFHLALARLGKDSFKVDLADLGRGLARG